MRRFVLALGFAVVPLALVYLGAVPSVVSLLALASILTFIFWLVREHIETILLVFLAVILSTTVVTQPRLKLFAGSVAVKPWDLLARSWSSSGSFDLTRPIVVHIVFDEMMSPGAITDDLPGAAEARGALHELAERHGFRTFDGIYSRDFFSGVSLPNLMGADYRAGDRSHARETRIQPTIAANAYFDDMASRGYRTIVFQTSHLDFCANTNVDACETFDSFDPGEGVSNSYNLAWRTLRLSYTFLRAYDPSYVSTYGKLLLQKISGLDDRSVLGVQDRYDVQGFSAWFDRFARFVAEVPRGTHVFAHFMVPHAPYLLTAGCEVGGQLDAGYYLVSRYRTQPERDRARLKYYSDYFSQLSCVAAKIDALMTALEKVDRFRDATIVIHGDHGSRISAGNVLEDYQPRDFIDNYATYFAIKAPGVQPGVDCEFVSLPQIFRRYITGSTTTGDGAPAVPVAVISRARHGATTDARMPRFGCAAGR